MLWWGRQTKRRREAIINRQLLTETEAVELMGAAARSPEEALRGLRMLSTGLGVPVGLMRPDDLLSDLFGCPASNRGCLARGFLRAARNAHSQAQVWAPLVVETYLAHCLPLLLRMAPDNAETAVAIVDMWEFEREPRTTVLLANRSSKASAAVWAHYCDVTGVMLEMVRVVLEYVANEACLPADLIRPQDSATDEDLDTRERLDAALAPLIAAGIRPYDPGGHRACWVPRLPAWYPNDGLGYAFEYFLWPWSDTLVTVGAIIEALAGELHDRYEPPAGRAPRRDQRVIGRAWLSDPEKRRAAQQPR